MAKILFCAVDAGAYEATSPVASLLAKDGHDIHWMVEPNSRALMRLEGSAANVHKTEGRAANVSHVLDVLRADLVVAGVGSKPDVTFFVTLEAIKKGIPSLKVIDFYRTGMPHEEGVAPDRVCVIDETSRGAEAKSRGMPRERVIATGAPQFDSLAQVKAPPRSLLLGREENFPFLLVVTPSTIERTRELLEPLLEILVHAHTRLFLGVLEHPAFPGKWYLQEFAKKISGLPQVSYLSDAELRKKGSTPELIAACDLLLGTTSTALLSACYLQRPALSYLPYGGHNYEVLRSRGLMEMPPSRLGALLHAGGESELLAILMQFLNPARQSEWHRTKASMLGAQREHFNLDGGNTLRVAELARFLLRT